MSGGQEERLSELFCPVLCTTVVHNDTHTGMSSFTVEYWFTVGLHPAEGCG